MDLSKFTFNKKILSEAVALGYKKFVAKLYPFKKGKVYYFYLKNVKVNINFI